MQKLRLDLDGLTVESFEAGADASGRGTAHAHQIGTCSVDPTCGVASRGPEGYEKYPPTRYACCV